MKKLVKSLAKSFGYEIRSIATNTSRLPNLVDFLASREVDLVFDVGANAGQFARALRRRGYGGHIMSFEPIGAVFDVLKQNAKDDPKWEIHNFGLGERAEEVEIHVSDLSVYSSILPQSDEAAQFDPRTRTVRVEKIRLSTVDEVARPHAKRNAFLKIDTQGFERQVLAGAKETLKTLRGVQLELPIVHLYRDNWTLVEAVGWMAGEGFIICQIAPVIYRANDPVSLMEIDCVFRRKE